MKKIYLILTAILLLAAPVYADTFLDGVEFQVAGSYQASDADLTAIAALSCTENQIIKRNGAGAWICATDENAGGDVTSVLDDATGDVPMLYQAATAFTINDETPSVAGKTVFKTANAATPTTITQFDGLTAGQIFFVLIDDVSTTVDFSQANLSGNGELSYTAASGDLLFCFSNDGTVARCQLIGGGLWGVSGTISDEQLICAEITGGKLLLKSCGAKTTDNSTASHIMAKDDSAQVEDLTLDGHLSLTGTTAPALAVVVPQMVYHAAADTDPTAAQMTGTGLAVNNYDQGAEDVFVPLPTAVAGLSGLFEVVTAQAGNHWGVQADTNDKIYLIAADGTIAAGDDHAAAVMTAAVLGQTFACWTFLSGNATYDWKCKAIAIATSTFAAHAAP